MKSRRLALSLSLTLFLITTWPASAYLGGEQLCPEPDRSGLRAEDAGSTETLHRRILHLTAELEGRIRELGREAAPGSVAGPPSGRGPTDLHGPDVERMAHRCAEELRSEIYDLAVEEPVLAQPLLHELDLLDHRVRTLQRLATGAAVPRGSPVETLEAGSGTFSGTVTDEITGDPVGGVEIDIYDLDGRFATDCFTDATGGYTVPGLAPGTYFARAFPFTTNFLAELYDDLPCPAFCAITGGTPITVTSGATTSGIDFALTLGGSISGTLTEEATGEPIASARVRVFDGGGLLVGSGSTDTAGVYRTTAMPGGTVFARTSSSFLDELYDDLPCPGRASCDVAAGTAIAVSEGAVTAGIDFQLGPGASIAGRVTDQASGDPLASVRVEVSDVWGPIDVDSTGVSGTFKVSGLPAGTVFAATVNLDDDFVDELYDDLPCPGGCAASSGTPIQVTDGATTTGVDFALARGACIAGRITETETGDPIPSVLVEVLDGTGDVVGSGRTEAAGNYRAPGLPAGTLFARTSAGTSRWTDELFDDIPCTGCNVTTGTPIRATAGIVKSDVDFALEPPGSLSGTVTAEATGTPVAGAVVQARDLFGNFLASATTAGDGSYTLQSLPRGNVFALVFAGAFVDELYDDVACPNGQCNLGSGTPIPISSGAETPNIDFALVEDADISGKVISATGGVPLSGVLVNVFDQQGRFVATGLTDFTGRYLVVGLAPGSHFLTTTNYGGFLDELYDDLPCTGGACVPTAGTPVVVGAGARVVGIDFELAAEAIFEDGFESGDLSAWSSAVGGAP